MKRFSCIRAMLQLTDCQRIITANLHLAEIPADPSNLYDPIRYILDAGGKRIRPSLVLMACNVYRDDVRPAIFPALAIEVFHNFTLMHDDIMDNAELRRNQPTVHNKWNRNTAILSGDAMLIKSYELLHRVREHYGNLLFSLFDYTAMSVCEGQQYDLDFEKRDDVTLPEYMRMIRLKTAVLLASSLKTGAIVGGAKEPQTSLFFEFGLNLGLAFQLQDDMLDLYADPVLFGKELGNDVVSNKKTFLHLQALSIASEYQKAILTKWMQTKEFNREEKINAVKEVYDKLNIKQLTIQQIDSYYCQAVNKLDAIKIKSDRKKALITMADFLLKREH